MAVVKKTRLYWSSRPGAEERGGHPTLVLPCYVASCIRVCVLLRRASSGLWKFGPFGPFGLRPI